MLADLHGHFPMHVLRDVGPRTTLERMLRVSGRSRLADKARALLLKVLARFISDRDWWSGPRISVPYLRQGGVGVVFSVLYRPFEEMDLDRSYTAPPASEYFAALLEDLDAVERAVARENPAVIRVVRGRADLDRCVEDGAIALVHCVEGGFHLGDTTTEIAANVRTLAERGVAYITLAHLFFRQVAANAPALPFLADSVYDVVFPQGKGAALTERGEAAVRAMVEHGVIVDVSHMRSDALKETFELLDELDPGGTVPVISSHAGYRFGGQEYMHDEATVREIARRDGVIGLIFAQHQLNDGLRKHETKTIGESVAVIKRHIDELERVTGGHRHVALGTDFDGFIKPTLGGIEDMRAMAELERELIRLYGADAAAIGSGNALRVLRAIWR
ncbi:MAG TPA: membrane dipeptidase [Solirubrobacteraceae bacterium]|nr:membrane dipeptidase [Solirubrobacteraceae bacterium]